MNIAKFLTLPVLCILESCIEAKVNFFFSLLCGASKGFMEAFKAFIKRFEAPLRSVKIKV